MNHKEPEKKTLWRLSISIQNGTLIYPLIHKNSLITLPFPIQLNGIAMIGAFSKYRGIQWFITKN